MMHIPSHRLGALLAMSLLALAGVAVAQGAGQ